MEKINYSANVKQALADESPIVALESTVITHGLPMPKNLEVAQSMEDSVLSSGAIPATIGVLGGDIHIGLEPDELERLASSKSAVKISRRDIAGALLKKLDGGTTVSGTMTLAEMAGLKIFATGGIGGIHRGNLTDVSADLPSLARIPVMVVCSGAKSILDLPATREYLETVGVPVIGYQTNEFPAFYSKESGLKVDFKLDSPVEIAKFAKLHWELGLGSAILVTVPVPDEFAIPASEMDGFIDQALEEMEHLGIKGAASTPFLLSKVSELTGEKSMRSNIALLKNNARVAGEIAVEYYR